MTDAPMSIRPTSIRPTRGVLARRAIAALLRKEFLQIRRDPVILRMLFVMPVVQLLILANAATFTVNRAALWVADADRTPASRALVERFTGSGRFVVAGKSTAVGAGDAAMRDGRAAVLLGIPDGFARDIERDRAAGVQLVFDAVNGSQAGVTYGYALAALTAHGEALGTTLRPRVSTLRVAQPAVQWRSRGWFNTRLDYRQFMVPGLLVQLVTLVGTLMTALNIVREKEAGTLDSLNVTPTPPVVFIVSKLLPLWIIGLVEFTMGLGIAVFVFHVPFVGSPLVVYAGAVLFLFAALGVGLWISTITDTQQQALFVTFSLLMVYILMSGLFTPVRGMPDWARAIAQLNPMLHFIALVRAVMLRGAGWGDVWAQLAALGASGAVILLLAVRLYRKQSS
ncbi:MAG: ABC transporter permease [Gemmatimonadetes bacterium]|nr:ABC transporter permease [Gemmatimonadota bacterium]